MSNRRRLTAWLATLLTAVGLVAVGLARSAQADVVPYRLIQNYGSGMCLQPPPGHVTEVGFQLVQAPCHEGLIEQRWTLESLGGNSYRWSNRSTFGCMDAHGPNANRTPVDTWPCSTISNQRWIMQGGNFYIKSAIGGRCLDVAGGSLQAGAPIQIYACTSDNPLSDNPAQAWFIRLPGDLPW